MSMARNATVALCLLAPVVYAAPFEVVMTFDPTKGELPESITVDHDGNLYLSMPVLHSVDKLTRDGQLSTFGTLPIPVFALGVKVGPDGCVYNVSTSLSSSPSGAFVWRMCGPGNVQEFAALDPQGGPNDLAFDDDGNVLVTDPFLGQIWKVTPDGTASVWLAHPLFDGNPANPALLFHEIGVDGIAFDADKRNLYVTNLDYGYVVRVAVQDDGSPGPVSLFAADPLLIGADGIAFDKKGTLYVTVDAQDRFVSIDPAGAITVLGQSGVFDGPSSVVFGDVDADKHTLYITDLAFLRGFGLVPGTPHPALLKTFVPHKGLMLP